MKHHLFFLSLVSLLLLSGCASKGEIVYACDPVVSTEADRSVSACANTEKETKEPASEPASEAKIYVAVMGEVNDPGIYVFEGDTRLFEAINAAGGATDTADLSGIDLVKTISKDATVVIPKVREEENVKPAGIASEFALTDSGTGAKSGSSGGLVNLNTASRDELTTLRGVGGTRADAIIEYREAFGGFNKIEDLMNVSGIGEATFAKLKDYITVD
ncbi:MAG: helix-hairpin-helix domain-containing protein [Lachnospiraceae bacterium]|nr:helix-hairpin-helix domain-containing protein [Lachnospiraceae bacterium]